MNHEKNSDSADLVEIYLQNNLRYLNALRCRYYSYHTPKPHKWTLFCHENKCKALFWCNQIVLRSNVDDTTENISLYVVDGMYEVSQRCHIEADTLKLHQAIFDHQEAEANSQNHSPDLQSENHVVMAHLSANNCLLKHPADTATPDWSHISDRRFVSPTFGA